MTEKGKNIEDLFREEFSDFSVEPDFSVWKRINRKLNWQDFLRFRPGRLNIYYTSLIFAAVILSILLINNESSQKTERLPYSGTEIFTDKASPEKEIPVIKIDEDTAESGSLESKEYPDVRKTDAGESDISGHLSVTINETVPTENPGRITGNYKSNQDEVPGKMASELSASASPVAFFVASVSEGCVPLQVEFRNLSSEAELFSWSFGDGGQSSLTNPHYIFDEPGEFIVNLTVTGADNIINSYSQVITVYHLPDAEFTMDIQDIGPGGIPVYFYNSSKDAESFEWNFGDGGTSSDPDPSWIYEKLGDYNITLTAKSSRGCIDSMVVENAFYEGVPEIRIPNAFSPNPGGPVGGYFSAGDNNNDVFHPWFEETPVEYMMRIFNRKGNLIFETKDVNIGWDGYFNQSLQPHGVYVYKIRARFKNGKTIVKMGDVTLFLEK